MSTSRRHFLKQGLAAAGYFGLAGLSPQAAFRAFGAEEDFNRKITELMLKDMKVNEAKRSLKVLVLGGTAFLGPACVEIARARGHEVTLFNRGKTNAHLYADLEQIHGDRKEGHEGLASRRWDVVLDTSGYIPRVVDDAANTLRENVEHYCFISSVSVYADQGKHGLNEDDPVGVIEDPTVEEITGDTYGPLKALCEQAAEASMPGRVTNIRPGLIVGPMDRTDRFTYWPVRVSRGGEVLAPNRPGNPTQIIDVRDLGAFVVKSMEQRIAGVFNATSKAGQYTMGRLLETSKKVSASDASFTWCDTAFLEEHEVEAWSEMTCWVPEEGEFAGLGDVDVRRALERGMTIRPLAQTVASTLDWWNTQPESTEGPRTELRAGLDPEKEAEVLAAWHTRKKDDQG
jgi:nucleoside-diphosphate-sugar epimerase